MHDYLFFALAGISLYWVITSVQDLIIANENVDKAKQDLAKAKQEHQEAIQEFGDVLNDP